MIKPIETFDAYFSAVDGNKKKLFGLAADKITVIEVMDQDGDVVAINDFFTKGGALFISVDEVETTTTEATDSEGNMIDVESQMITAHFYQQKNKNVIELESMPERPPLNRAHYDSKEFTITETKYDDKMHSDVKNVVASSGTERFFMVDGFYHFKGAGLFFNVAYGRYNDVLIVRRNGLYFWSGKNKDVEYLVGDGTLYK